MVPSAASSHSPTPVPAPTEQLSSGASVAQLKKLAASALSLTRPVRLWRLNSAEPSSGPASLASTELSSAGGVELVSTEGDKTLVDAMLTDNMSRLVVEEQNADGTWVIPNPAEVAAAAAAPAKKGLFAGGPFSHHNPNLLTARHKSGPGSAKASSSSSSKMGGGLLSAAIGSITRSKSPRRDDKRQRGLTGLTNLGNTCFMNSALQCMSNTKELQEYFASGAYHDEINRDNPLGMGGAVAEAFGALVERLWASSGSSVAPREFKQALARFAPQFSGYGQQDTQELLAFLLDGTHEDLNRIHKKPATNAPDWEGGGDKELVQLAQTCWDQYRSRNDSVIVDLFQGQYKSTVTCPDCDKVSITFDPFQFVTTGLPVTKKWTGVVYFVPLDPSKARVKVELELPKSATVKSIKSALGSWFDTDAKRIICTETWKHKFYKHWFDDDSIIDVTDQDQLVFYETLGPLPQPKPRYWAKKRPAAAAHPPDRPIAVVVVHRQQKGASRFGNTPEPFGEPFILSLTHEQAATPAGIYHALAERYASVSTRGVELLETVEGALEEEEARVNEAVAPAADVALPESPPTDGMQVDQISEPSTSTESAPAPTSASASVPKPRGLFKVRVSKSNNKGHLPLEGRDIDSETVSLSARARAYDDTNDSDEDMFANSLTSLPGSFAGSSAQAQAQADQPEADSGAEPSKAGLPTPLVRTGDWIETVWEPAALERYFGGDGEGAQALWTQVDTFVDPSLEQTRARAKGAKKTISLTDCLNEFTKEERLGEDDQWYCSACKEHKQATKKVELWKVPDVLIFALKRFSTGRYARDKIDDLVDFPFELDMQPFVEGDKVETKLAAAAGSGEAGESLVYDLYAVDNHYGGLGGGHYTAYAKNHENGKWYDFDDSRVSEVHNPASVVTKAGYLLFYRRRTSRPIGGTRNKELINSAIMSRSATLPPKDEAAGSDAEAHRHGRLSDSDAPASPPSSVDGGGVGPRRGRTAVSDTDDELYGEASAPAVESRYPAQAFGAGGFVTAAARRGSTASDESGVAEGPASSVGGDFDMVGEGSDEVKVQDVDVQGDDVVDIRVDEPEHV